MKGTTTITKTNTTWSHQKVNQAYNVWASNQDCIEAFEYLIKEVDLQALDGRDGPNNIKTKNQTWRLDRQNKNQKNILTYALQLNNKKDQKASQGTNIFQLIIDLSLFPSFPPLQDYLTTINVKEYWSGFDKKTEPRTLRVRNIKQ